MLSRQKNRMPRSIKWEVLFSELKKCYNLLISYSLKRTSYASALLRGCSKWRHTDLDIFEPPCHTKRNLENFRCMRFKVLKFQLIDIIIDIKLTNLGLVEKIARNISVSEYNHLKQLIFQATIFFQFCSMLKNSYNCKQLGDYLAIKSFLKNESFLNFWLWWNAVQAI